MCETPVDYFSTCASCPCLPLGTVYSASCKLHGAGVCTVHSTAGPRFHRGVWTCSYVSKGTLSCWAIRIVHVSRTVQADKKRDFSFQAERGFGNVLQITAAAGSLGTGQRHDLEIASKFRDGPSHTNAPRWVKWGKFTPPVVLLFQSAKLQTQHECSMQVFIVRAFVAPRSARNLIAFKGKHGIWRTRYNLLREHKSWDTITFLCLGLRGVSLLWERMPLEYTGGFFVDS